MKKSLIALAALAAVAGAAQAQSSVSVYGILDVGYSDKEVTSLKYTSSSNSYSQTKTDSNGVTGVGSESTSRLGFRGTEDLGGGLKANFVVETGLNPAESTVSSWNTRQAYAGLQGGFGSLNVGTVYTPQHIIAAGFSATTLPNVAGDVMYTAASGSALGVTLDKLGITQTSLGVGGTTITTVVDTDGTIKSGATAAQILAAFKALGNYTSVGTTTTAALAATTDLAKALNTAATTQLNTRLARGNNSSYTVRVNNTVSYQSPEFNGLTAGIAYVAPTRTKVEGGNETETSATALNIQYASGKFAAAAAQTDMKQKSVGNGASAQSDAVGILSTFSAAGANTKSAALTGAMTAAEVDAANTWEVKTKETMAALSYDLGVAKVSYIYAKRDAKDTVSDLSEKTTHNFGVKAPFGKTTAFVNYSMGDQKVLNGTNAAAKFDLDGIQVGASYALSKRSDIYAIYGSAKMDNTANNNDIKDKQYAVGLRHSF